MPSSKSNALRAPALTWSWVDIQLPIAVRHRPNVNHKSVIRSKLAQRALYFFGSIPVRLSYRATALGLKHLPNGGFLLLPNHISFVDALVLQLACPRHIRYIIDEEFYRNRVLRSEEHTSELQSPMYLV